MGYTIPEIDNILEPYCQKSYDKYYKEFVSIVGEGYDKLKANDYALSKVKRDLEQGFQGLEIKLNSVASSRGDYPSKVGGFGW